MCRSRSLPGSRPGRRRLLALVLTGLLALLSFGCADLSFGPAGRAGPADDDALHRVLDRGTLRVGMSGVQPPLNMKNRSGELIGLDADLARELANAMRVSLELVEMPFSELLGALERGEIDLVISSLTITPARNARVAFAGPYLISGTSLLTRKDLIGELETREDLDSPGRTWAALAGSTGEELIGEAFPLARYVAIEDQAEAVARIEAGTIDGLFADLPFVRYEIARHPEVALATLPTPLTTEPLGVALPAGSPLFSNLVQNYLNTLDYTGELMRLKSRWLNAGDWLEEMP